MKLLERKEYMSFLQRHKDRHIIKVVSGVRRCGKSKLFELFQNDLLEQGVSKENIISINFEDLAFEDLQEYHALYQYVTAHMQPTGMNYIFLDEIQHVPHFEKAVDSLFIKDNTDVYITGSNAYFMSGELATLLSGRYVELKMLPLSFKEYYEASNLSANHTLREIYERYITESSFPYTLQLEGRQQDIHEYLTGLYNTVLLKDVIGRLHISDVKMLESIVKYLFANVGSLLSIRKIAASMTSAGRKIDSKTVEKYLTGLQDSLLVYQADRFDIRGKELLKINPKYYVVDAALRYLKVGRHGQDTGHILENTVYLELLRRGYEVYVGSMTGGEVDFVTKNEQGLAYYQISESTLQPEVMERELKPLQRIRDNYPKFLLTLDEIESAADYNGICKQNVLQWLLDK
ncbi:ATP-binding protein [Mitsuokella sp. WILCCON 0060]|uniref:ATP-binding protein n=1 Tax=Mitsuokella sp. WILCCON 0060 TaxID=3345341 RepID=UPI003F1A7572